MENINPIFILIGLVPLTFSIVLILYWRRKRTLKWIVLLYSLIAYAVAIAAKTLIQSVTYSSMRSAFGYPSVGIGLYFGLQTVFLEVGLAYLVARYAVKKGHLGEEDAESYGISLSFWENGILIGLLTTINMVSYYLILGYGSSSLSTYLYNELMKSSPGLFKTGSAAAYNVFLSNLERTSSALAHIAWGMLTMFAVVYNRKRYLFAALPMGMIDALVPYASTMGITNFELTIFVLSVLFIIYALHVERSRHNKIKTPPGTE